MSSLKAEVTQVLEGIGSKDNQAIANELFPLVYNEFRSLAKNYLFRERNDHTLQPTALVHEAYMKLVDQDRIDWQGKTHFFAVGAQAMRRILVDHARTKGRVKRGGDQQKVELEDYIALSPQKDEDVLALEESLEALEKIDERQAQIVEMRFFGGMTVQEVAEAMGLSKRTVESDWTMAKAWLRRHLKSNI